MYVSEHGQDILYRIQAEYNSMPVETCNCLNLMQVYSFDFLLSVVLEVNCTRKEGAV